MTQENCKKIFSPLIKEIRKRVEYYGAGAYAKFEYGKKTIEMSVSIHDNSLEVCIIDGDKYLENVEDWLNTHLSVSIERVQEFTKSDIGTTCGYGTDLFVEQYKLEVA